MRSRKPVPAALRIGERSFDLQPPADLAETLLAAAGVSVREAAQHLARSTLPVMLARALHPFLKERDSVGVADLAGLIAEEDGQDVREAIAALYPIDSGAVEGSDAGE